MVLEDITHFLALRSVPLRFRRRPPLPPEDVPDDPIIIGSPIEIVGGGGRADTEGEPADEPGESVLPLTTGAADATGEAVSMLAAARCNETSEI